jgi:hypothetical protein
MNNKDALMTKAYSVLLKLVELPQFLELPKVGILNVTSGCIVSIDNYGLKLSWGSSIHSGNQGCTLMSVDSIDKYYLAMELEACNLKRS